MAMDNSKTSEGRNDELRQRSRSMAPTPGKRPVCRADSSEQHLKREPIEASSAPKLNFDRLETLAGVLQLFGKDEGIALSNEKALSEAKQLFLRLKHMHASNMTPKHQANGLSQSLGNGYGLPYVLSSGSEGDDSDVQEIQAPTPPRQVTANRARALPATPGKVVLDDTPKSSTPGQIEHGQRRRTAKSMPPSARKALPPDFLQPPRTPKIHPGLIDMSRKTPAPETPGKADVGITWRPPVTESSVKARESASSHKQEVEPSSIRSKSMAPGGPSQSREQKVVSSSKSENGAGKENVENEKLPTIKRQASKAPIQDRFANIYEVPKSPPPVTPTHAKLRDLGHGFSIASTPTKPQTKPVSSQHPPMYSQPESASKETPKKRKRIVMIGEEDQVPANISQKRKSSADNERIATLNKGDRLKKHDVGASTEQIPTIAVGYRHGPETPKMSTSNEQTTAPAKADRPEKHNATLPTEHEPRNLKVDSDKKRRKHSSHKEHRRGHEEGHEHKKVKRRHG
ncbi:MAG: hypothetical protein M1828_001213 [Chrysothrix sp. TS-e1954]|nr:MAG: hypothetical protein M1828_001213 [Chrysothrix sp. TS-e1954]